MGLRPTRANENQRRHPQAGVHGDALQRSAGFVRQPRAGGGPCPEELDSRLRGNDMRAVIPRRAAGGPERNEGRIFGVR